MVQVQASRFRTWRTLSKSLTVFVGAVTHPNGPAHHHRTIHTSNGGCGFGMVLECQISTRRTLLRIYSNLQELPIFAKVFFFLQDVLLSSTRR